MGCRVTKIGPFTQSTGSHGAFKKSQMVRDWDAKPGAGQKIDEAIARKAQGQRMVPKGAGNMRPTKG